MGHEWKKHRVAANPAFQQTMPVNIFGNLARRLFEQVDRQDGPVEINGLMNRYSFDCITMAGLDFCADAIGNPENEWVELYTSVIEGAFHPFFSQFPMFDTTLRWMFPSRVQARQKADQFFAMVDEVIARKQEKLRQGQSALASNSEKDLCTLLLEAAMDGSGRGLTNDEIRNDVVVYILAGHHTTASAISSAVGYLAANKDVQTKVREEILACLGNEPVDVIPTDDQIKRMPYLNMVIKETLRIASPSVSLGPRYAAEDCELAGHFVPKGTTVVVHVSALQRDPQLWEDPDKFVPDRFDTKTLSAVHSYLPFGKGQRKCIGMNLSLVEQITFLAMLQI
ncbi:Cytochrome P450 3A4 [Apophysomyces ossiformis]|uniref:Cytochrome P450 3A4 n=1 Tax=Apophysomyces ossiformis TaxID=679940 RepID=A0A8H7BKN3_9FUNG|nr:Cytochrome P450 3A4 [Apophysomyces ossiformis]